MNWQHHFNAAEGYLEIGLPLEAADELERMAPEDKGRPHVYALRLQIYLMLEKWDLAEACAKHLAEVWPDQSGWWIAWARCLRHTENAQTPPTKTRPDARPPDRPGFRENRKNRLIVRDHRSRYFGPRQ